MTMSCAVPLVGCVVAGMGAVSSRGWGLGGCWVGVGLALGWRWVGVVIGATVEPAVPLVVYANPYADDYQAGESLLSWSAFLQ